MKKPTILIVDDDPDVLESLVFEMSRSFGNIARVEAFESPGDALEWASAESERFVAVAILDEKMPEMRGTSLVSALRGHLGPETGRHLRTIMLTGYSSLETAIDAKNDGGIDRFLEKPWRPSALRREVRGLLRSSLAAHGILRYLAQSVASDHATILEILKLRYKIYRMTPPLDLLIEPSETETDATPYDINSVLMALVRRDVTGGRVVGTLRLSFPFESPDRAAIEQALHLGEVEHVPPTPASSFPILKVYRNNATLQEFIEHLRSQHGELVELGRHAIEPEERKGGTDRRLLEGAVAFSSAYDVRHWIAAIPPVHQRHYRPFGSREVSGVPRVQDPIPIMAIWAPVAALRPEVEARVDALLGSLACENNDTLCFCSAYPKCIREPYVSGDFRGVDIFCPKQALNQLDENRESDESMGIPRTE